jgi:hypothetical protein
LEWRIEDKAGSLEVVNSVSIPNNPCPFCGAPRASDGARLLPTCSALECIQAADRIPLADVDSRGPARRRGRIPQPEAERIRKNWTIRIRPELRERLRRAAERERVPVADYLERLVRALPE